MYHVRKCRFLIQLWLNLICRVVFHRGKNESSNPVPMEATQEEGTDAKQEEQKKSQANRKS